jgi:hypothetical protein
VAVATPIPEAEQQERDEPVFGHARSTTTSAFVSLLPVPWSMRIFQLPSSPSRLAVGPLRSPARRQQRYAVRGFSYSMGDRRPIPLQKKALSSHPFLSVLRHSTVCLRLGNPSKASQTQKWLKVCTPFTHKDADRSQSPWVVRNYEVAAARALSWRGRRRGGSRRWRGGARRWQAWGLV